MKRLIFKYLSIVCCLAAVSCTYEYDADIPSDTSFFVIDGTINTGAKSRITLSKAMRLDGTTDYTGIQATGRLECEDGTVINNSYTGTGYPYNPPFDNYYPPVYNLSPVLEFDTVNIDPAKKYKLYIDAGEDGTFESDWLTLYDSPVIDDLHYTEETGADGIKYLDFRVSAHSDYSPYFVVSYTEAWEHTSLTSTLLEYFPQTNTVDEASWSGREHPYYRCWQESDTPIVVISSAAHTENRITDAYINKLDMYNLKISVLYRIIVNVTSSSKDYYEYWDNLRKVSYVDGDLFTPIPSNMEGNIHRTSGKGNVIGYIGAGAAAVDTLYYKNKGFYRFPQSLSQKLHDLMYFKRDDEYPDDLHQYYCPSPGEWRQAYALGNVPIREAMGKEGFIPNTFVWGRKECVDCRLLGGNYYFPDDWPDRNDKNL
ncbi:MAG: DUF4249 family protein [Bacteroidales bacterium]|nr:DUF4249 family protein [Bacteroidales bacterium]